MLTTISEIITTAFGLDTPFVIPFISMCMRGMIIYFFGITLARFNKKLMGLRTPFNFILFIMLGSTFANAIINADFFLPILCTIAFLILLNGIITVLAFYVPSIETLVKGTPSLLIKNGKIQWDAMKQNYITERELKTELGTQLHTTSFAHIALAFLASDGTINFIEKDKK